MSPVDDVTETLGHNKIPDRMGDSLSGLTFDFVCIFFFF